MRRVERKASAQQAGASKSAGSVTGKTAPVVATSSKSTTLAKPAAATSIFARKKAVSVAAEKPAVVVKEKTAVPVVAKKAASAAPLRVPVPTTETLTSAAPVARKRAMVIFDDDEDDVEEDAAEVVPKPVTVSDEAASSAIPVHSEPAVSNSTIAPARDENGSGSGNGVEGQSIVAPESPQKGRSLHLLAYLLIGFTSHNDDTTFV